VILAAGSEQAKQIRQQHGRDAGLKYLEQVMTELLAEREKQLKVQQRTGIDRSRQLQARQREQAKNSAAEILSAKGDRTTGKTLPPTTASKI